MSFGVFLMEGVRSARDVQGRCCNPIVCYIMKQGCVVPRRAPVDNDLIRTMAVICNVHSCLCLIWNA